MKNIDYRMVSRSIGVVLLFLFSFLFGVNGRALAETHAATRQPKTNTTDTQKAATYQKQAPDFSKLSERDADQITSTMIEHRARMINLLIWQLGNTKLSNHAKVKIINLLGAYRARNAVGVLIKNINFVDKTRYLATAVAPTLKTARTALIKIGLPSSITIETIVSSKSKNTPFDKSQVEGFAEVLYYVEGPRYALIKLKDKMAGTKDADIKAQCKMMIDGLKKFTAHVRQ